MQITIRPCTALDINSVLILEHQSFEPAVVEAQSVFESRLKSFAQGFLVFEYQNTVQGYFVSELWQTTDCDPAQWQLHRSLGTLHSPGGSVLTVSSWCLDPRLRRLHLGQHLFQHSVELIRRSQPQIQACQLLVNTEWSAAIKIYSRLGFVTVAQFPQWFATADQSGSVAQIMHRSFG